MRKRVSVPCPGSKIRSRGQGRGMGVGGRSGPIGRMGGVPGRGFGRGLGLGRRRVGR